jgi:hypothetical protein
VREVVELRMEVRIDREASVVFYEGAEESTLKTSVAFFLASSNFSVSASF